MTHLFTEMDVFFQPDWMSRRVRIAAALKHLILLRPATIDLILTKMMRGADPEDMSNINFLPRHEPLTESDLVAAFHRARVPEIAELHDAFGSAQPKVLELVRTRSSKS